jgi:hypothetical protein
VLRKPIESRIAQRKGGAPGRSNVGTPLWGVAERGPPPDGAVRHVALSYVCIASTQSTAPHNNFRFGAGKRAFPGERL